MTKLLLSVALLLLAVPCRAAPTPEQIIDAYFGPTSVAGRADAYIGEMKQYYSDDPTVGQMLLGTSVRYTVRRLPLSPDDAPVYDVALHYGDMTGDWYAYFTPVDGTLKLRAVRSLGPLRESDTERLARLRPQVGVLTALKAAVDAHDEPAVRNTMRTLHFGGWTRNKLGQLEIRSDDKVADGGAIGVLYVPPGEKPPPLDETGYIYVEQIAGPWYAFKTKRAT